MAVLATNNPTLTDLASRLDPGNKVAAIVELLAQQNPVLEDMSWMEGNLPTGHRTTVRSGLPTVQFRGLNEGISPSKSTTAQITEDCAMLDAMSTVDVELAKLNGNSDSFRLSEASAFIEAMNQKMVQTLFYGNVATDPKSFTGFTPRYNVISGGGQQAQNIINAGTVSGSDGTSVWLSVWGPNTVTGIYPQGSTMGLAHEDRGVEMVQTSTGVSAGMMRAFVDYWTWKCGLVVRDWRYLVRICNIDVSNLASETGAADLTKLMIKAIHRVPSLSMGRPVFYVSRTVREMLDIQALNKASNQITLETFDGKRVTAFQGIPIRTCDQILETEAQVS
jgi:hypothetical protein